MDIRFEDQDRALIVRLGGSLTSDSSEELEGKLLARLGDGGAVVMNLGGVDYISSAGIGSMVKLYKELQDRGYTLTIVSAAPRVRMLFELAGLTELVPFMEREIDALTG